MITVTISADDVGEFREALCAPCGGIPVKGIAIDGDAKGFEGKLAEALHRWDEAGKC